jgi:hypothetical protein
VKKSKVIKQKTKDLTRLCISAKCSDMYSHTIYDKNGEVYRTYDGYVPSFMPGQHFGDYIELEINPYTGKILNWKPWKKAKKTKGAK